MKTQVEIFELVEKAFQDERLTVPMTEIEKRAGRRQARWVPRLAAVVVLAMLAGFFWWQQTQRAQLTTLDTLTQACLRHWAH